MTVPWMLLRAAAPLCLLGLLTLAGCGETTLTFTGEVDDEGGATSGGVSPEGVMTSNGTTSDGTSPGGGGGTTREPPPFEPAPATLHRLTGVEYLSSVKDLLGVESPVVFEDETSLHGFVSVAASELTLPPALVDAYEEGAWAVARAVISDPVKRGALVGCDVALSGEPCLRAWLVRFGRRAWRRPLSEAEVNQLVQVAQTVATDLRDPWQGVGAAIAVVLQSPYFVFRVERGEPHPDGGLRLNDYEIAARLSFLIWGTTPDDALLAAAERGELTEDEGLRREALRLLDDPRAADRLKEFFLEFIGLERLDRVTKDPEMFPEMSDALKESMRREIELMFLELALTQDSDLRDLLTTDVTFVDRPLAELYGLDVVPGDGEVVRTELPPEQGRGGMLGRAALLTLFSHASVNSPTLRGRFVRSKLLCIDVPPPPEGVVTELAEPEEEGPQTLRQRLDAHRSDPLCAGCHNLMDPLGYPLEHFDPIGKRRELDNGLPIDATGDLDGVAVDGAAELAWAVAEHPKLGDCLTRRFYRYATGHLEQWSEERVIRDLGDGLIAGGFRFQSLVVALVMSDGFRRVAPPIGAECVEEGQERACQTLCGAGVEVCTDDGWAGCTAPVATDEVCDGEDNDCDRNMDEGVLRACDGSCGPGVQRCGAGGWGACEAPEPPAEICDGEDNDCDGAMDEGLEVDVRRVPFSELAAAHGGCEGQQQRRGPECNAAINRMCSRSSCAATGFGPVGTHGGDADVVCLSPERVQPIGTHYSTLVGHHPNCNGSGERIGPNCNAAIHRFCRAEGLTSGFGPLEHSGDDVAVGCTPGATVIQTSYTVLSAFEGSCQASGQRIGPYCDVAIQAFCRDQGHRAGFGPVENSGDVAYVTCVD